MAAYNQLIKTRIFISYKFATVWPSFVKSVRFSIEIHLRKGFDGAKKYEKN